MKKPDLSFLYYIAPDEFRDVLDGDSNEYIPELYRMQEELADYLKQCDVDAYFKLILSLFVEEYPEEDLLHFSLFPYNRNDKNINQSETPYQKDSFIKRINLEFTPFFAEGEIPWAPDRHPRIPSTAMYLSELKFTFRTKPAQLSKWVEEVFDFTPYEKENGNYIFKDLPVNKISITDSTMSIYPNKDTYVCRVYGTMY